MTIDNEAPRKIIEDSDTPEIVIAKIGAIRSPRRDKLDWPELFVLEGYNWQTGTVLDRQSPDYAEVKARQDQLTERDSELSLQAWGADMRAQFPEWLGTGTVSEVMAQCKTPQQKARLILRQAGETLNHDWYDAPEFQSFVMEIRRIANTPAGITLEPVPNDIYVQLINLTRDMAKESATIDKGPEGIVQNGAPMIAKSMNDFISAAVKAGLAETSASRRPRSMPGTAADAGVEHPRQ